MITDDDSMFQTDCPSSLLRLCLNAIVAVPSSFKKQVFLPKELGHAIAKEYRKAKLKSLVIRSDDCEDFFKAYYPPYISVTKIDFSHLPIRDDFLEWFISKNKKNLKELNLEHCERLTTQAYRTIHKHLHNPEWWMLFIPEEQRPKDPLMFKYLTAGLSLKLGGAHVLPIASILENKYLQDSLQPRRLFEDDLVLSGLSLSKLDLWDRKPEFERRYPTLELLFTPTLYKTLTHLEITHSRLNICLALNKLESIEELVLYDCEVEYKLLLPILSNLKTLKSLDLSRYALSFFEDRQCSPEEIKYFEDMVGNLTKLTKLDVSGTCLIETKDSTWSAFKNREDRPFEFLGLFRVNNPAVYRCPMPACRIASEATESQLLNACEAYRDRPEQLTQVLIELNNYYKSTATNDSVHETERLLDVLLPVIDEYLFDEDLMGETIQSLWWVIKLNFSPKETNLRLRRAIISSFLDIMFQYKHVTNILFYGVFPLVLSPSIAYEYVRVAEISLLMTKNTDPRIQGWGVAILNTLGCQVGGEQKEFIGSLKLIETMIQIINSKIDADKCDDVLENAWGSLWNITDETPANCRKFLEVGGLATCERCMDHFSGSETDAVLRNIMGLLGNVAECQELRTHFITENYIQRFCSLLRNDIDGIECSYNACGILAHLISDKTKSWNGAEREFEKVQMLMRETIMKWPINSDRHINYRSFTPIANLLNLDVAPAAQLWAVWALTNLSRKYPSKYCPMILRDGALEKMLRLKNDPQLSSDVALLVENCIYQYNLYNSDGTLHGLEQSDELNSIPMLMSLQNME